MLIHIFKVSLVVMLVTMGVVNICGLQADEIGKTASTLITMTLITSTLLTIVSFSLLAGW